MKVTITGRGLEKLGAKVTRRANFLGTGGMLNVLHQAADDLLDVYKNQIRAFTPGSVPDLAESTKKSKRRQVGFIYPILIRTQQLLNSMYMRVRKPSGGKGWGIQLGFAGSQNGTANSRIAEIHITGEGNMPERDFTKVPKAWRQDLIRRIRDALRRL